MKNIKKLLAFVAVLALALTGVFALVACTEPHECGHVCPVEGCGKCLDKDCQDPACAVKCPGHEPAVTPHVCGHICPVEGCGKCLDKNCTDPVCANKCLGHDEPTPEHECEHVCETCGKCLDANCDDPACADKCLGHDNPDVGYTITLVVGVGSLEEGTSLTYKTDADGKLSGYLPEPTANTAHWKFDNWYDAETGGSAIDETVDVFTEDTTIYARYIRENGVWLGETFKAELIKNASAANGKIEYWLGGSQITLQKGEKISLYIGGKLITHFVEPNSAGVVKPASDAQVTEVEVSVAGPFAIYLHENASDWSCEYSGPTEINIATEIPEGCDAFKVTIGTNVITFYLVDSEGEAVAKADFDKYCIYTYQEEIFGAWAEATTKGVIQENMTATGAVPNGWIFRWGSGYGSQTANIIGVFKAGKTYVIELPAATNGDAKVSELNLTKYTVTLDLNYDGQPDDKDEMSVIGGKFTLPADPTREDYDFAGWYTAAQDGTKITETYAFDEDTTIYAHWTAKIQVTVNLNYDGADEPAIVKANYGKLNPLPTATREGYYLIGWFTAAEEGDKITVDTVLQDGATIYAHWGVRVDATVTVNYNYEGCADPETISITAVNGNLIIPFPTAPEREGYEFLGWYTTAVDTEEEIGELVTAQTEIHADITIYARYATVHTLTIVVEENGSIPDGAATTYKILDGKIQFPEGTTALPTVTVSKAHWKFAGWYEGTTAVNVATKVFDKDTTLTAKVVRDDGVWVGETFKAALVKNNGASGSGLVAEYWLGGGKLKLDKGDIISIYMKGDKLSFYILGSSAGIEDFNTSNKYSSATVKVAGDFEFYVKDYDSTGKGTNWVCEFSGPTEVIVGSEIPAGCAPIHVTWGTNGANEITFFLKDVNGNPVGEEDFGGFVLYSYTPEVLGTWQNGVLQKTGYVKLEMNSKSTGTPTGWIFRWGTFDNQGNGGSQTSNITGLKIGSTYLIELKGHQKAATVTELAITKTNTITLDKNYTGTDENKTATAYNGKLTFMPFITREGYDFAGWYDAAEGGNEITFDTAITENITIYAHWTLAKVVTFDLNYDGQPEKNTAIAYGGKLTALSTPVRANYDFIGWFTEAEGGEQVTVATVYTADTTIYAHWSEGKVVSFNLNYEGSTATVDSLTTTNGKLSALPADPVREGYDFAGWYTVEAETGGSKLYTSTNITANVTYYARWTVGKTVTFDLNYEGQPEEKQTANTTNKKLATLPTPEREGYTFDGWYTTATGTTKVTESKTYSSNTTIYAHWTAVEETPEA